MTPTRSSITRFIALFVLTVALVCAGPVTVTFLNAGPSPVSTDFGGVRNVDIGNYSLNVGGVVTPAMCIDFSDTVFQNESWSAYATTNVALGTNWYNTYMKTSILGYESEATLSKMISAVGVSSSDRIALQEAAWAITDVSLVHDLTGTALTDYNFALANPTTSGYTIYSAVNPDNCQFPQEFIAFNAAVTTAPEPTVVGLMSLGLMGIGLLRRNRKFGPTDGGDGDDGELVGAVK